MNKRKTSFAVLAILMGTSGSAFGQSVIACDYELNAEWPWPGNKVCQVETTDAPDLLPLLDDPLLLDDSSVRYCSNAVSDPDGDGWGWENFASCRVPAIGAAQPAPVESKNSVPAQSTTPQGNICQNDGSDPDGDGWGWENHSSCIVSSNTNAKQEVQEVQETPEAEETQAVVVTQPVQTSGVPVCQNSNSDPDGDGWGWENHRSCVATNNSASATSPTSSAAPVISNPSGLPSCTSAQADPDGDGWGWENNRSCIVSAASASSAGSSNSAGSTGSSDSVIDEPALKDEPVETVAPLEKTGAGIVFEQNFEAAGSGVYTSGQLNKDWSTPIWHLGINSGRARIVEEARGKVLEVTYPGGKYGSAGAVAFLSDLQFDRSQPKTYEELYLSYDLKFSDDFEFVRGGKLPGLCGYNTTQSTGSGCNTGGGYPTGYDGWSARSMWRVDGTLENYLYHSAQKNYYGDDEYWQKFAKPGQWHNIQHRVVMNDPGVANGTMQAWLDGELVLDLNNIEFRKTSDIGINLFYFSTFYGGADGSWAPTKDQMAYFDNFVISTESQVSSTGKLLAFDAANAALGTGGGGFSWWMLAMGLLIPCRKVLKK